MMKVVINIVSFILISLALVVGGAGQERDRRRDLPPKKERESLIERNKKDLDWDKGKSDKDRGPKDRGSKDSRKKSD